MISQEQLLNVYRAKFPNYSFSDIARHTGIHRSRVFRIFNGQELKLSEYWAFIKVISLPEEQEKLVMLSSQEQLLSRYQEQLPPAQLERLSSILERYFNSYFIMHNQATLAYRSEHVHAKEVVLEEVQ